MAQSTSRPERSIGSCATSLFASSNGTMPIGDQWFENARQIEVFGSPVRIVGPTELIWSKCFIQLRHRYDGADVALTKLS